MFPVRGRIIGPALAVFSAGALATSSFAETAFFQPGSDTTLIEISPDNNLGGAGFFNAGTAGNGNRNRALFWFDLASQIPVGAIIQNVTLSMDIVRQPVVDWQAAVFGLHRVTVSWGEGDKIPEDVSPGLGFPATPGDATWNNRFFGGDSWSAPGGQAGTDFALDASAATLVLGLGDPVQFEGSAGMTADVQAWVDHPDQNFGWMFMTESEEVRRSARSFASRESGFGPLLMVEYVVVPEPGTVTLLSVGLGFLGVAVWRKQKHKRRLQS